MWRVEPLETEQYKGYTLEVYPDEEPDSPRNWDNLGTMACWHRQYSLGDQDHGFVAPGDFLDWAKHNDVLYLGLYLYDHGGITMRTAPFSCPWDSGQVGFIFVTAEDVRREWRWQRLTRKRRQKVLDILKAEVETYDIYLTGQVVGWTIRPTGDPDDTPLDSCWGYYSTEHALEDARSAADGLEERPLEERAYRVQGGTICPKCRQATVEPGGFEPIGGVGTVERQMACTSCSARWTATYDLAGYTALTVD